MIALAKYQGRLGNQMFQIASTIGIAMANKQPYMIPDWYYEPFFEVKFFTGKSDAPLLAESGYQYERWEIPFDAQITGYLQSYRYFEPYYNAKKLYKFSTLLPNYDLTDCIAIHVRGGDYIGNPNYHQLGADYYLKALQHIPHATDYKWLIFSDSIAYAKNLFAGQRNAVYSEGNSDIVDLCLMSQCQHFVTANSSFSWWAAYLGERADSIVLRPEKHFAGALAKRCHTVDLYPERWIAV